MSYYKDLQRAYAWIQQRVDKAKDAGFELDANAVAYEATKQFPVGEKKLIERMRKMKEFEKAPIEFS